MKYNFLYGDYKASAKDLDVFEIGKPIHDNGGIVLSSYRGGLLSGCNLRTLYITNVGGTFQLQNEDYRMQWLFIFDLDYSFQVLDIYRIGDYTQVLLTPGNPTSEELTDVVKAARADFNQLIHTPPVGVLNTDQWRRKLGKPIGTNGKTLTHT